MSVSLPQTGASDWGVTLNDYITNVVMNEANATQTAFASHISAAPVTATPADPHGDRAYAQSLISPLTSNTNKANGYVKLPSDGLIPTSIMPTNGGMYSGTFDVQSAAYGAVPAATANAATDQSAAIQAALNAAGTEGGGEVWLGPGYYGVGTTLVIPSGVWFHLAPGAGLVQLVGSNGTAPAALVTNFAVSGSSPTSGNSNILVSGGMWIFTKTINPAGAAIVLAKASNIEVTSASFTLLSGGLAALLGSMSDTYLHDNTYVQGSVSVPGAIATSQQAITGATGYNFPASLASSTACSFVSVQSLDTWHTMAAFSPGYSHDSEAPVYKFMPDGTVAFAGKVNVASTASSNQVVGAFGSSPYYPITDKRVVAATDDSSNLFAEVIINTSGQIQVPNYNVLEGQVIFLDGIRYPLDY